MTPQCMAISSPVSFNKLESVGTSSAAGSPSSSCASARAHYYQSKLFATLQILQNKEETVRVQAESLAVAESRISCLTARNAELKQEFERKGRELQTLRKALEESRIEKIDVSTTAHLQDSEDQEKIVSTLQNNLSVIEDLYRDCFYETVKQYNLIDLLRKSYLDVRLMEKDKSEQITKLHNVINAQKWSLDKCEDIAAEVDNLKLEITAFLNNSNNDSGMWEESFATGLNDDLQDIAAQLLKLRELLTGDCTCGLEEENARLKEDKRVLEAEISNLRMRISELEVNLTNTENLNKRYQEQMKNKDSEINHLRDQNSRIDQEAKNLTIMNENLNCQLSQAQETLDNNRSELLRMQERREADQNTIRSLTEELNKTEEITKEIASLRAEVCSASGASARLQRRALALQQRLADVRTRADRPARDRVACEELAAALAEARARGARLCGEARAAAAAARRCLRRADRLHREQEEQIKQKECEIRDLQQRLEQRQNNPSNISRNEKCCSARPSRTAILIGEIQCPNAPSISETEPMCSKQLRRNEKNFTLECNCMGEVQESLPYTSASEMGSCGSTPVPPKRTLRKNSSSCVVRRRCGVQRHMCEAAVQRPVRRDAAVGPAAPRPPPSPPPPRPPSPPPRRALDAAARLAHVTPLSPAEEMFSRLENMSAALADGYRRWTRHTHDHR